MYAAVGYHEYEKLLLEPIGSEFYSLSNVEAINLDLNI